MAGLRPEGYERLIGFASTSPRKLADGKTLVANSEQRLQSVLATLEECRSVLIAGGDSETAQLISLAILQLRMKINRITDAELQALCDAMTLDRAPRSEILRLTQGQRQHTAVLLKLVK
jgi:hypothetical protein